MNILKHIDRGLGRLEGWLIVFFLWLMILISFLQIILRTLYTHAHMQWANYILGQVDWAEPCARLLVLWLTFLGASLVTGENKHIKIDLMSAILPQRWLPFRELVLSLACVIICALMFKASLDYVWVELSFGGRLFLKIPTWVGQLIIPAGFLFILFRFFLRGLDQLMAIFRGVRT
jgi:TRAP-type C4-dicarboxylate transport system permease small subunit